MAVFIPPEEHISQESFLVEVEKETEKKKKINQVTFLKDGTHLNKKGEQGRT